MEAAFRRPSLVLLGLVIGCDPGGGGKGWPDTGGGGGGDSEGSLPDTDTAPCAERAWYGDGDGDGYGAAGDLVSACEAPPGYVSDASDCDDASAQVYPGADEICGDGRINDCDDTSGAAAAAACPAGGPFQLSAADVRLLGENDNDGVGWSVARAGDVDGDGRDDVLVGAPYSAESLAYRVVGPLRGAVSLGDTETRLSAGDLGGWSVASAGDQDGDGLPDMVTGQPGGGGDFRGRVLLILRSNTGALSPADADAIISGTTSDDYVGRGLAGVGDVDGDGWDDLLIGAPLAEGVDEESGLGHCADDDRAEYDDEDGVAAGNAFLVRGPVAGEISLSAADALLYGEDGGDAVGSVVAGAGDLDGDGGMDLLVNSTGQCEGGLDAGAVYAMLGPVAGEISLADADFKAFGEYRRDQAGQATAGAGDVNGDGYADLVVGAPQKEGLEGVYQGKVYVLLGPSLGAGALADAEASVWGESPGDLAGYSVAPAGDLDMDGNDDLLVGAQGQSSESAHAGAAYVLHGPLSGSASLASASLKFIGSDANDHVGWAVSGAGDVDADGLPDLWVSAPGDSEAAEHAGAVSLILSSGAIMTGGYGP